MHVSMRVTSRGNALVHELQEAGTPLDATKYDHPVTMLYVDGDQLTLVHYCDAGNRPRMTGKMSPDGKTVEFEFVDISGSTQYGTCTMRCSPSSMPTITPRIGRFMMGTSRSTRTSTCTGQLRRAVSLVRSRFLEKPDGP